MIFEFVFWPSKRRQAATEAGGLHGAWVHGGLPRLPRNALGHLSPRPLGAVSDPHAGCDPDALRPDPGDEAAGAREPEACQEYRGAGPLGREGTGQTRASSIRPGDARAGLIASASRSSLTQGLFRGCLPSTGQTCASASGRGGEGPTQSLASQTPSSSPSGSHPSTGRQTSAEVDGNPMMIDSPPTQLTTTTQECRPPRTTTNKP